MPFSLGQYMEEQGYLPAPIISQTGFEKFFGMAPGSWIPGTAQATAGNKETITKLFGAAQSGVAMGGTGTISKMVGSSMTLGGVGLALAGREVSTVGLPAILGKVFKGVGTVAKSFLGLGGGAVAAGVGGAAVGAVATKALSGGGATKKKHRHHRGLSKRELTDLMMMKAVMGPGASKSPAFQLAMMKAMG